MASSSHFVMRSAWNQLWREDVDQGQDEILASVKCNHCRAAQSRFAHTLFNGAKIDIHTILYLSIMWLAKSSMQTAMTFSKLAKETVTNYYGHFCQLVTNMIDQTKLKIGGSGIEVEIDELKLAKRKYNRGRCVGDKSCVFHGIEKLLRNGELKWLYFCCHCARSETNNTWTNHQSLHWERMHHYVQLLEGIQLHWKGWEWLQAHKCIFQFPPPRLNVHNLSPLNL